MAARPAVGYHAPWKQVLLTGRICVIEHITNDTDNDYDNDYGNSNDDDKLQVDNGRPPPLGDVTQWPPTPSWDTTTRGNKLCLMGEVS